ncbi:hypothetical protein [Marinoscillum furvescens]|uniref:HEAT repeat protein n=1 Tax=Marinoscillum furvescens DSM 4134 TaxID=1122208 RepID=A0A3D9L6F8_MARFU|nr:hypothetical protein [Marinoscillum furvescens]RED99758.1 hypothetical protein C7460_10740 [Marinoscillum furvescens DSM 4134]
MSIRERLSRSLSVNNEGPNKTLAAEIVQTADAESINELISLLQDEHTDVVADTLKVLEMVGLKLPALVGPQAEQVFELLNHPSNKIQWRAMCVLSSIAHECPKFLEAHLPKILEVMDNGTVITRDHGVKILLALYPAIATTPGLLLDQIQRAPDNQLGQYAEKWATVITPEDVADLILILENRLKDLHHPSHQKRISRVLKKLHKKRQ